MVELLESEAYAVPIRDLSIEEPETLVAALDDSQWRQSAQLEIDYRLTQTPLANRHCCKFLLLWSRQRRGSLSAADEADFNDAFDGLRRCCFKAIGDYYYAPAFCGDTHTEAKRAFIEERILIITQKWRDNSEQDTLIRALKKEFRHIPREIRCDLLDLVRKQYTDKAKRTKQERIEVPEDVPDTKVRPDLASALRLIILHEDKWIELLGPLGYRTLLITHQFGISDSGDEGRQARKSGLTKTISMKYGVTERRASEIKRALHSKMAEALRSGNPYAGALFDSLRIPPEKLTYSKKVPPRNNQNGEAEDEDSPWLDLHEGNGYVHREDTEVHTSAVSDGKRE